MEREVLDKTHEISVNKRYPKYALVIDIRFTDWIVCLTKQIHIIRHKARIKIKKNDQKEEKK